MGTTARPRDAPGLYNLQAITGPSCLLTATAELERAGAAADHGNDLRRCMANVGSACPGAGRALTLSCGQLSSTSIIRMVEGRGSASPQPLRCPASLTSTANLPRAGPSVGAAPKAGSAHPFQLLLILIRYSTARAAPHPYAGLFSTLVSRSRCRIYTHTQPGTVMGHLCSAI